MLLSGVNKETIIEKFSLNNQDINQDSNIIGGSKKKIKREKFKKKIENKNYKNDKSDEIDEIYTVDNINIDSMNLDNSESTEKKLLKQIPVAEEIATYLPDLNSFMQSEYTKTQKKYIYDIKLEKGFPNGKHKFKFIIYEINNFNTLPFLKYLLYKKNTKEDKEEHLILTEIETDNIKKKSKEIVHCLLIKDMPNQKYVNII